MGRWEGGEGAAEPEHTVRAWPRSKATHESVAVVGKAVAAPRMDVLHLGFA